MERHSLRETFNVQTIMQKKVPENNTYEFQRMHVYFAKRIEEEEEEKKHFRLRNIHQTILTIIYQIQDESC